MNKKSGMLLNDERMRNICFVGGGVVSKAGKNYANRVLERFSNEYDREVWERIKSFISRSVSASEVDDRELKELVQQLNLVKPPKDPIEYQVQCTRHGNLRQLQTFTQQHLGVTYLRKICELI